MYRRVMPRLCAAAGAAPPAFTIPQTPGKVRVMFITPNKKAVEAYGKVGAVLMEVGRDVAKVDIEAACDGTCACSTCHMYIDKVSFAKLPVASEDELDMLDLAPAPKATSRLGCQVKLTEDVDGMIVTLPDEQHNQLS